MSEKPKSFVDLNIVREGIPGQANLEGLTNFNLATDEIPHPEIADLLRTINRRFDRFPLKTRAFGLYTNNRINILGNKETVKVPSFLPAWRVAGPRGLAAFVNAVPYIPGSGPDHMDARVLFGLILAGEVLIDAWESWAKVSNSTALARAGAAVYSKMVFKVVDRIAGTGADRMRADQLKYLLAKYFMLNLMGMTPGDGPDAIAAAAVKSTTQGALDAFEGQVAEAAGRGDQAGLYACGLFDLVAALSASSPWLSRLTRRGFTQTLHALYGAPAMLAAEDFGYFMVALVTHQAGSELVNSYAFAPVFEPDGTDAIAEFARLVDG
jgi:hypothetical protein